MSGPGPNPPPGGGGTTRNSGWGDPSTWAQPGSTVPTPQTAAGAPPRPRGRGWLVVLLVVVGLIVAMLTTGTVLFATRTLPPYNAARHFLDDVANNRSGGASHLCSAEADRPAQTVQQVRRHLESFGSIDTVAPNLLGVDRNGSTATVDFTVSYHGRTARTFSIPVVEEHSSWKACP